MTGFEAIRPAPDGFVVQLGPEEREVVVRLLGELRALLEAEDDLVMPVAPALARLFPVVHPDNRERESEYQRLMRDELRASRMAAIDTVSAMLSPAGGSDARSVTLTEQQLIAFMQAVNGVRLVLGTVLDVSDDDTTIADATGPLAPEYHLYAYLSWLLDAAVEALS